MEKRTCPNCGMNWYSADSTNNWLCEECGALLPKKEEKVDKLAEMKKDIRAVGDITEIIISRDLMKYLSKAERDLFLSLIVKITENMEEETDNILMSRAIDDFSINFVKFNI